MTEDRRTLTTKLRTAIAALPYLPRTLALVWAAARYWTLAGFALTIVQGLMPVATVWLTKLLVDGVVAAARTGGDWASVRPLVVLAIWMGAVLLVTELLRAAGSWIRTVQGELLKDHISGLIHDRSIAADLAFYELPECYDHLHRARDEAGYRPLALLQNLGSLLQNGITLVAMGALLIPFGLWLPVVLLLSTLPALVVVLRHSRRQHQWRRRTTADERRSWYYDWLLTTREAAAELRLFGLGARFQTAYQALRGRLRTEQLALIKSQSVGQLGAGLIALLGAGGSLGWMLWKAAQGRVSLGDLALFYQAFNQGQQLLRSLLDQAGQIYANSLYLGNLFEFLALRPKIVDRARTVPAPLALKQGIGFHNLSFRYPGSQRLALEQFNLQVPAGQVVAIVGPNGAGKSTLIKLLCRFYDPDAGRIDLDGIDLRDLPIAELRSRLTVLFQEPVHYSATAAENIRLGDREAGASLAEIEAAARAAGADECVARLPGGYGHLLGKWFEGGAELSVGEWQRIALARAFLRQAPVILLDEPTSAMDSWAEADWLARFRALARGRTVLMITHRFTTARRADTIHVMAGGRIVESGSHDQLLGRAGLYAQSWAAQMRDIAPTPAVK